MKLLLITQKLDKNDSVLGFFHRWVVEFAKHFKKVTVICLYEGEHTLPENVRVFSLGKENGESRIKYIINFFKIIWRERKEYDGVFVHMNQEYVLLGGFFWKMLGKRVGMWRNHHAGSLLTDLAVAICDVVFCTSRFSYTAKFKKTVLMPVGIDASLFKKNESISRLERSILFLARISPIKKPDILIDSLCDLKESNEEFTASIYGDALPGDEAYYESLKKKVTECGLAERVKFFPAISNFKTPEIYSAHAIFVNLSTSGMYDKTIFEAAACGCLPLASNKNLVGEIDDRFVLKEGELLTEKLRVLLHTNFNAAEIEKIRLYTIEKHSLEDLVKKVKNIL